MKIIKNIKWIIMKIKDYMHGFPHGRRGNIIYYTRNDETYMRRYEIPGKKRKWEIEGRTQKQREVTARFTAVQSFYKEYMKQVSPVIWRTEARARGKMAPNLFYSTNFHCFDGQSEIVDFEGFKFSTGKLALPRDLQITREGNCFHVSWQEERDWSTAARTDVMQVGLLYDKLTRSPRLALEVKGCRGDLRGEFTLDESIGQTAHVYIFFAGMNQIDFSPSWHVHVE
jgi:hypothetical protein